LKYGRFQLVIVVGEPEDFVVGEARAELYDMIMDLMTTIGCD